MNTTDISVTRKFDKIQQGIEKVKQTKIFKNRTY